MIKLFVEKYCHNCSYFEPEVTKREDTVTIRDPLTLLHDREMVPVERTIYDTSICCKHRVRCESIIMNFRFSEGG